MVSMFSSSKRALGLGAPSCALWQNLATRRWQCRQGEDDDDMQMLAMQTRWRHAVITCLATTMILRSVEKQMKNQCEEGKAYCWMNCLDGHLQHCPHCLNDHILRLPWWSFVVPSLSPCLILIFQFLKSRVRMLQPSAKTRCLSHHDTSFHSHPLFLLITLLLLPS